MIEGLKVGQKVYMFNYVYNRVTMGAFAFYYCKILNIDGDKISCNINSVIIQNGPNNKVGNVADFSSLYLYNNFSAPAKVLIKTVFKAKRVHLYEKLEESLEKKKIKYSGTREFYEIHDENPNILIIDKDYNVDGHGNSILGINLNYLDSLDVSQKRKLLKDVNKLDNKVLDIKGFKSWLKHKMGKGDYGLTKDQKIKRYKKLVAKFPILKKAIRRYKYEGIK